MEAAKLFEAGKTRAEVAGVLNTTWRSAHSWHQQWRTGGIESLASQGKPGPELKFSDEEAETLRGHLIRGAVAHGYPNDLWTLRRVNRLVRDELKKKASASEIWRLLKRMNWSPQKPKRVARERNEVKIQQWKDENWPELCKKAAKEKRTIIFVDECGFSQKSTAKKT